MYVTRAADLRAILLASLLTCAATAVLAASADRPGRPPQRPECLPNVTDNPAVIHARLEAVQAEPAAVLPKIELARCFDLIWQLEHVEPAVAQAQAALDAEMASLTVKPADPHALPMAGADVPTPRRLSGDPPPYPDAAREDGVSGIVIVEARIDREGRVRDARAVRSIKRLDDAALRAVSGWRYAAPLVDGREVDVRALLPVKFSHMAGQQAADLLDVAAFYYSQGWRQLARAALMSARAAARAETERYGRIYLARPSHNPTLIHPRPLKRSVPTYTARAMREKITGEVDMYVLIDRQGAVGRASVIKPLPFLNIPALEAAMRWVLTPATLGDTPVSVISQLTMTFQLH